MQCTSLGLYGSKYNFEYLGFVDKLENNAVLADAIYNPDPTAFLAKGQERGLLTVNGMGMLACQKRQIFKACLNIDIGDEGKKAVKRIVSAELERRYGKK